MKKWLLVVVSVAWLLAHRSMASAAVFIPDSVIFESDQDGAWEFPAVVYTAFIGTEAAQDWLTINIADGLPEEFQVGGGAAIVSDTQDIFVRLNNPTMPQYLVSNRLGWVFSIPESRHVWLRFEYRLWSQETERGFDEPVLVVYHGNALIYRENVFEHCLEFARTETICQWRTKRLYLGSLSGQQALTFLAGEMGDLQKPTGVDIRALKLETQVASVSPTLTATPIPTPTAISTSTPTPTPIFTSQAVALTPTSTPSQINSPLVTAPEPKYVTYGEPENGQVLGASDADVEENEPVDDPKETLRKLVFHPWFFLVIWGALIGITVIVWRLFHRRKKGHS